MFPSKVGEDFQKQIASENEHTIDPIDEGGIRVLASAVILDVIKRWRRNFDAGNKSIKDWLRSKDFRFWARMAGLDVSGEVVIRELEKNGGIHTLKEEG